MKTYTLDFEESGNYLNVTIIYAGSDAQNIAPYSFDYMKDIEESIEECIKGFTAESGSNSKSLSSMQQKNIRTKLAAQFVTYVKKRTYVAPKNQRTYDPYTNTIVQKIFTNQCAYSVYTVDKCFDMVWAGQQHLHPGENGAPKHITFNDDQGTEFYGVIDSIQIFPSSNIELLKQSRVEWLGVAFKSSIFDKTVLLSLRYIGTSTRNNDIKFYENRDYNVIDANGNLDYQTQVCLYNLDNCTLRIMSDASFANDLSPALSYYNHQLKELQKQQKQQEFPVDLMPLREHYDLFERLIVDESLMLIPVIGKASSINGITLWTQKENNRIQKYDFNSAKISVVSKEDDRSYRAVFGDEEIRMYEIDTFCILDMIDSSDKDVAFFKKIVLDENILECTICNNIEGEKTKLKRIVSGIETSLKQQVANIDLVDIICQNDMLSKLPDILQERAHIPNEEYIDYLKKRYPRLNKNQEQLMALDKIAQMPQKNIDIMLIQGPPGTGKTELILSLAKELMRKKYKTLITSNVHVACDNVADRLKDNRNLALKRYTTIRGDQYTKEFIENQKKYVEHQVLAGFQFEDYSIFSQEKYLALHKTLNKLSDNKVQLQQQQQTYDNTLAQYERTLKDIALMEYKVNSANQAILKRNRNKLTQLLSLIVMKKNVSTEKGKNRSNEQALSDNEHGCAYLEEKIEAEQQFIETLHGENTKRNREIAEIEKDSKAKADEISKINDIIKEYREEYAFISTVDIAKTLKDLENLVKSGRGFSTYAYRTLISNCERELDVLSNLYRLLARDDAFWSGTNAMSPSTLEHIYFNTKRNEQEFACYLSPQTCRGLEDIYDYYNAAPMKKKWMSILPIIKLKGKGNGYYLEQISLLTKELKNVQYCLENLVLQVTQEHMSENILDAKSKKILAQISDSTHQMGQLQQEIQCMREKKTNLQNSFRDSNERIEQANDELYRLKKVLSDKKARRTSFDRNVARSKEHVEVLQLRVDAQHAILIEIDQSIENLKNVYNTSVKEQAATTAKATQFYNVNKDVITQYELYTSRVNIGIKDLDERITRVQSAIEKVDCRMNKLVANGWSKEEASVLVFNYVNELISISKSEESEVSNFFKGKGTAFDSLVSITDNDEGSLISMTTSQIASILNNTTAIELTFDFAIVDEASKCCFEDLIISLPRVKHLILIGDFMQLDPMYDDYSAIRPLYQNMLTSKQWDALNRSSFSTLLSQIVSYNESQSIQNFNENPCVAVMKRQYRMNKGIYNIIEPIYKIHSGFELIDEKNTTSNDVKCIEIEGRETKVGNSTQNVKEATAIVDFLIAFQKDRAKYPKIKKIGVITGYSAQEKYLRRQLKTHKIPGLQMGTFDRFQGREFDLVIVSLVRSEKLGFTNNIRRMNVAFSRAKSHLLVFGNFTELYNIARKSTNNNFNSSGIESQERLFVTKTLLPNLYGVRESFVSADERIKTILDFIKEENS